MKYKFSKEQLETAVKNSLSISEVCRKLGIVPRGGNYKTLKSKLTNYNISIIHFTGKGWNQGKRFKKFSKEYSLEEALVKNSPYINGNSLKKRLIRENILSYKCDTCKLDSWNRKFITLELDHINGINNDNRLSNLRLLCPNCHSQTQNFRGKNKLKNNNYGR